MAVFSASRFTDGFLIHLATHLPEVRTKPPGCMPRIVTPGADESRLARRVRGNTFALTEPAVAAASVSGRLAYLRKQRRNDMRVKQIMTSEIATCRPDTNLAAVTKLMWDRDCGFVPVVDADGKTAGVITDRDICIAAATRGLQPDQIAAEQAMKPAPVFSTQPDDTIEKALATMKQFQVHRLPVIAADGALKGVISMNDIVLAAQQSGGPAPAEILSALSSICAHRPAKFVAA
jgi:CBS-domain-containing membrane protein